MPVRIRRRDKPLDRLQAIEYKGVNAPSTRNPRRVMLVGNQKSASFGDESDCCYQ